MVTKANKFWKKKRDPETLEEVLQKMAGDFPNYWYTKNFLTKFITTKQLKKLVNKDYFFPWEKDKYILGPNALQQVHASKTVELTEKIERLTWVMIGFAVLQIIVVVFPEIGLIIRNSMSLP